MNPGRRSSLPPGSRRQQRSSAKKRSKPSMAAVAARSRQSDLRGGRPPLSPFGRIEDCRHSVAGCDGGARAAYGSIRPSRKRPAGRVHEYRDANSWGAGNARSLPVRNSYSPYHFFSSEEWAKFRADTPLTLTAEEVARLRSMGDPDRSRRSPAHLPLAVASALLACRIHRNCSLSSATGS